MAERDPREYRGGVHEPEDAKGGSDSWADNEGVVPREMVDEPTDVPDDEQALGDAVRGEVTDRGPPTQRSTPAGGDEADATRARGAPTTDVPSG